MVLQPTARQSGARPAKPLQAWIDSVGLIGPGLPDWPAARRVFRASEHWQPAPTEAVLPPILPPAERRRTSLAVRIALAAGHQATSQCSFPADELVSVFASSGGDGLTCHLICEALAQEDRRISPTHFHNSVHNAPSGYWGIAMRATPASTSLCGYDASFGAGLLEALTQLVAAQCPVILIAYDAPYPEPLLTSRPVADAFGLALVLSPHRTGRSTMRMSLTLDHAIPTPMREPALETLRRTIPTARALPLLRALARHEAGTVVIDYLDALDDSMPPARLCLALAMATQAADSLADETT